MLSVKVLQCEVKVKNAIKWRRTGFKINENIELTGRRWQTLLFHCDILARNVETNAERKRQETGSGAGEPASQPTSQSASQPTSHGRGRSLEPISTDVNIWANLSAPGAAGCDVSALCACLQTGRGVGVRRERSRGGKPGSEEVGGATNSKQNRAGGRQRWRKKEKSKLPGPGAKQQVSLTIRLTSE